MSRTNRCKYEIIGEIMTSDEKEVDEKLYRVVRKKGSHVNTKVNPDGTKSALLLYSHDFLFFAQHDKKEVM